MRTTTRTRIAAGVVAVAIGAMTQVWPPAQAATPEHPATPTTKTVAQTKAAVAKYRTVKAATAAGYVRVSPCVASPAGAMGYHYLNAGFMNAPFDPTKPPFLTFGRSKSGKLELWAAEFYAPAAGQPTPMYGDQPFDGPLPGHEPGAPEHFELHVWVGKKNPAGTFAQFNPALRC